MPRIEFRNLEEAEVWIKDIIVSSNKNYHGYFTDNNELILIPGKSTRPTIYGLVYFADYTQVKKLFDKTSIPIYRCHEYEWNPDRGMSKE